MKTFCSTCAIVLIAATAATAATVEDAGDGDLDNLLASPAPAPAATICGEFNSYIPSGSGCTCTDASKAATLQCSVSLDGYLTVGARFVIDICGTPDIAFSYDAGDGWVVAEQFGLPYQEDFPIPGASVDIPFLGTIGAQAEMTFSGTLKDIVVSFGIGACLGETCDGQLDIIGSYLPVTMLNVQGIDMSAVADNICG